MKYMYVPEKVSLPFALGCGRSTSRSAVLDTLCRRTCPNSSLVSRKKTTICDWQAWWWWYTHNLYTFAKCMCLPSNITITLDNQQEYCQAALQNPLSQLHVVTYMYIYPTINVHVHAHKKIPCELGPRNTPFPTLDSQIGKCAQGPCVTYL